jgi:eukaryotic-like serine/threonine-protein kinase
MAAVWLARDERLERPVVIKVLSDTLADDQAYLARFQREARVAAGLSHPNLVDVYDFGTERGRPFLVMEYVEGGDLAARLARGRPPDPDHLARDLLGALRYTHSAGVLHRDVKSQNVLLDRDGRARLTDFGIARPRDATSLTQTGMVLGTASYLAPEVLAGGAPSERSDLYSLGVVLAEVTDARPGDVALLELIDALRAPDPDVRPASAAAALRQLERPPVSVLTPTAPIPTGPSGRRAPRASDPSASDAPRGRDLRRPLAIGALALALLAVLAIVALGGGGDGGERRQPTAAASQQGDADRGEREAGRDRDAAEAEQSEPESRPESEPEPKPEGEADGVALNDQGFALIQQGGYEEAIPLLERAVDALEGSGDITYAYALFNLGNALRLAGRPDEAIPILEARLEIPNQTGVVRKELEQAREDAGLDKDSRGMGPGKKGKAKGHDKKDD